MYLKGSKVRLTEDYYAASFGFFYKKGQTGIVSSKRVVNEGHIVLLDGYEEEKASLKVRRARGELQYTAYVMECETIIPIRLLELLYRPQRIVCAAIRAEDGSVLLGVRHYSPDMHEQIRQRADGKKFVQRHGDNQGFVDQHGMYLTRSEAYLVAEASEQIIRPEACPGKELYSEGLY